jgi:hypothetical protein
MITLQQQLEEDSAFRLRLHGLEHFSRDVLEALRAVPVQYELVTIPVVVHVLYKFDDQNVSDAQIRSQLDVLNRDFRARNEDAALIPEPWRDLVADSFIEFRLATHDPSGTPTTGIQRHRSRKRQFSAAIDDAKQPQLGGIAPWPSDRYLNLWVCELSGGLLGYATFPAAPGPDGVVIDYRCFGTQGTACAPFNGGRTAVHEVGHWLNLYHIWGDTPGCDGGDYVDDTPNAGLPNYGRPVFPRVSCDNGPHGDMFVNFMDYVDDDVMCMFTHQQVARMRATLLQARPLIGTDAALVAPATVGGLSR